MTIKFAGKEFASAHPAGERQPVQLTWTVTLTAWSSSEKKTEPKDLLRSD